MNLHAVIGALGLRDGERYEIRFERRLFRWLPWRLVRRWRYRWPAKPVGVFKFPSVRGREFRFTVTGPLP